MDYETTIDIAASAATVWQTLVDVEGWPRWTASTTWAKRLDGGELGVGSRVRIKQPKLAPLVWTVTELEAPRSFTWEARSPGLLTVGEHRLTAGPGEAVNVTLAIRQTGPLAGLIALLTARLTRQYMAMEAAGLKRAAEG